MKAELSALPITNANNQVAAIEKILELLTKYRWKEPATFHE